MGLRRVALRRFRDLPIRLKVVSLLAVGSLLPVTVSAALSLRREERVVRAAGIDLLEARADETAFSIEALLHGYSTLGAQLAAAPDVIACATAPADVLARSAPAIGARLAAYTRVDPGLRSLALLSPEGRILAASDPELEGRDYHYRLYFQEALQGRAVVSELFLAAPDRGAIPQFAFAAPVRDARGRIVGVIALWMHARTLWRILARGDGKAGTGSYSVLVDQDGVRIGHSSAADRLLYRPTRPLPPALVEKYVAERRFADRTRELLGQPVSFPELNALPSAGGQQVFRRDSPGSRTWNLGVVREIPEVGWKLAYMVPERALNTHLLALVRENGLVVAASLLLVLGAGAYWLRGIVVPIRQLAAAAESMREGDLSARVETAQRDELGELAESFNTMATRVRERTAQLEAQSRELEAARDAAMDASRTKSAFLATMSHELRTPLNGVIGMLALLADTELAPEQRSYAETARSSGEALLAIINDLLDLSKIEAGRMELEAGDFDPRRLIDDVLGAFAERAHRKGLALAAVVQEDLPHRLRGDRGRLQQVLNNLVGNAIKFTEKGEVRLDAGVEERRDRSLVLRFAVRDEGVGIPEQLQPQLFHPFSQVDGSAERRIRGTGLGLAISRELVERMRGTIRVESVPGAGSRFWFTVELENAEVASAAPPPAELRGRRVLLVSGDGTSRALLHHHVAVWELRDAAAASGPEALAALSEAAARGEPFHLIVLDLPLPGAEVEQLLRKIRALRDVGQPGIAVATGFGDPAAAQRARKAGAGACFTRPVRHFQLLEALLQAAGRTSGKTAEARAPARPERTGQRGRVLVADDNAINQQVAQATLRKLGYAVDLVGNGREALEALRARPYDAVLMDCQMPELDGYEATRRLRAEGDGARDIPVIAMTANALAGEREKCLAAGMTDYVSKPVTLEALEAALARALRSGGGEPVSAPAAAGSARATVVLDEPELLRTVAGDPELLRELVGLFAEDGARILAELERALEAGEVAEVERLAHRLRGSAASLGGARAADAALRLELLARQGERDALRGPLAQTRDETGRLQEALLQFAALRSA